MNIKERTIIVKSAEVIDGKLLQLKTVADKCLQFELREVTEKELLQLRYQGECGFVYKNGSALMYTPFAKDIRLNPEMFVEKRGIGNTRHICVYPKICGRFYPPKSVDNICQKTLDPSFTSKIPFIPGIKKSKRIEKYPFILEGYEIFNSKLLNVIAVFQCSNYTKPVERKKKFGLAVEVETF